MENLNGFIPKDIKLVLKENLKSVISEYYKDLVKVGKEPCSCGIFTDSDMTSFIIACDTHTISKNNERSNDEKWWIPEWESDLMDDKKLYHEDPRYRELESIMNKLKDKTTWHIEDEKNTFAIYKRECFDCMCEALMELKEEGLFINVSNDFFLLVQESDNGVYEYRKKSLNKILSKDQLEEYLKTF